MTVSTTHTALATTLVVLVAGDWLNHLIGVAMHTKDNSNLSTHSLIVFFNAFELFQCLRFYLLCN